MNIALIAGIACFLLAPVIGTVALNYSIVSGTAATRWSHAPKPLLGGISMFLAIIVSMLVGEIPFADHPILSCAGLFTAVGIIDDVLSLTPGKKLMLQFSAAILALRFFFLVPFSPVFGIEVIWIVLFVNAFNLIDGMDGLAVSFAIIIFVWIALLGNPHAFSYALLGVCLGFLPYNFRNASLYLGDSGSHFLGSAIAVLILSPMLTGTGISSLHPPDFLPLLYPVSDILFVSVTRALRRTSILTGGTDHIAHRLARVAGEKRTVMILLGITFTCIIISLSCKQSSESGTVLIVPFMLLAALISLYLLHKKTRIYFISKPLP